MIPIRTVILGSQPRFGYQPGLAADPSTGSVAKVGKELERDVKKAAIAGASAQVGLSVIIALIFVPVIGWAIGACIAVVSYFAGNHYAARTKSVIKSAVSSIKKRQTVLEAEISAAQDAAYTQEASAGRSLALSNQSLDGWGSFVHKVTGALKKGGKAVTEVAVKASTAPVHVVLKGAGAVASATGNKSLSREFDRYDDKVRQDERGLVKYVGDPGNTLNVLTGKNQLISAEKKCAELKKKAFAQMDKLRTETLAKLASPEYRAALRINIAKALRGDPVLFAQAARLEAEETAQKQRFEAEMAQEQQRLDMLPIIEEGTVPPGQTLEQLTANVAPATTGQEQFQPNSTLCRMGGKGQPKPAYCYHASAPTGVGPLTQAEQTAIAIEQQSYAASPPEAPPAKTAPLVIGGGLAAAAAFFLLNR